MSKPNLGAIVLAAGQSKRFKGTKPKLLHPLAGRPVVCHLLDSLARAHKATPLTEVCLVVGPGKEIEKALAAERYPFKLTFAVQAKATGTGAATSIGLRKLGPVDRVLVAYADGPLLRPETVTAIVRKQRTDGAKAALLTAVLPDGGPYGRIVRNGTSVAGVVEARDCSKQQRAIREINAGTYVFDRDVLERVLPRLSADNAQKERYLTDVIGELVADGVALTSVEADGDEILGTNTRAELAVVARLLRARLLDDLMDAGVTVVDPDSTYVDVGVKVGADSVLYPNTFLEGATKIGSRCEIGPNTRLVDTTVGDDAVVTFAVARESKIGSECDVGPFVSLRPGTVLAKGAKAGTFVEMKNAKIGEGSKVPHLAYMGDVTVGRDSNVGAGTITCNYDGSDKHATVIGDEAFIGSDSILVAPVRVGSRAYTGAGSVVTRDVPSGGLVYGVPAVPKTRSARKGKQKKAKKKAKKKGRT